MSAVGFLAAWTLSWTQRPEEGDIPLATLLQNPYSLGPVLKFGLLFVGIFFFVKVANLWMGEGGIYLASAIAGLGSVSAIALSVADMVHMGSLSVGEASVAILIALTGNSLMKWVLSWMRGTRRLALWLGGGLFLMLLTALIALSLQLSVHTE
jgi:uncharacterized membrane protein (DUF4010 family)